MNADKRRYDAANLRSFAFICGSNLHKKMTYVHITQFKKKMIALKPTEHKSVQSHILKYTDEVKSANDKDLC